MHGDQVKALQRRVTQGGPKGLAGGKNASNTLRNKRSGGLDLSKFNKILEINRDEGWALVEPRVTVERLVDATLKVGLVPPVVPEFRSITVGGAVMGAALESSSHRYGQLNDTCLEYEVVLGDGRCVKASREENSDLFWGISGSYGTLGIVTAVKVRLIEAKSHVSLTYHTFASREGLITFLRTCESDFVDGLVLDEGRYVGMEGRLCERDPALPLYNPNKAWSPWFYQHVRDLKRTQEQMPLKTYLFRLDRGAFWMGRYVLSVPLMLRLLFRWHPEQTRPFTKEMRTPSFLFRLLFGWTLSSQRLYKIWHRVPNHISQNLFFVHDFYTPEECVEKVLREFQERTQIEPIWLCPLRGSEGGQIFSPHEGHKRYINIGLYGIPKGGKIPEVTEELEEKIAEVGGRKMLYSLTYYTKMRFSKIYDVESYEKLRKKYGAEKAFLSLYDKIIYNGRRGT